MKHRMIFGALGAGTLLLASSLTPVHACTGIRLAAKDGSAVYGRSMEWGAFDLNSRVAIIPRGYAFVGQTPDGHNGKQWTAKYGVVGLDMLGKDVLADGMNEKGLAAGLFYHPGFAEYMEYERGQADNTITAVAMVSFILSQFATVDEVMQGIRDVRMVAVVEKAIGIPVQGHWMVTDASGQSIVIEYLGGELHVFDNPLGVITNAPDYPWHITNLRNYVNLSPVAVPAGKLEDLNFSPLGAGSGMIGLPGDFTPPSRFIRAVAWTQTARPTETSEETIYELMRILDNFNLPLGGAEGSEKAQDMLDGMRSSTIWTSAYDLNERVLYYHTQHNRRVRMLRLGDIDFAQNRDAIVHLPLDRKKEQDIEDITPPK